MNNTTEFLSSLNSYYKLKSEYEEIIKKEKKKIMNMENSSWREKRREYQKYRPKCINCKRAVGSIFKTVKELQRENESSRGLYSKKLIAMCGDRVDPCDLDIEIQMGDIIRIDDFLNEDEEDLKKLKNKIILNKNDLLFGYISSNYALEKFDEIKDDLDLTTTSYELSLEKYMFFLHNKENREELKSVELELYEMVKRIKEYMKLYESTQNTQFVKEAVEINLSMQELLKKRRELVYASSSIEFDKSDARLVQQPMITEQIEDNYSGMPVEVVKFDTGTGAGPKSRKRRK